MNPFEINLGLLNHATRLLAKQSPAFNFKSVTDFCNILKKKDLNSKFILNDAEKRIFFAAKGVVGRLPDVQEGTLYAMLVMDFNNIEGYLTDFGNDLTPADNSQHDTPTSGSNQDFLRTPNSHSDFRDLNSVDPNCCAVL